MHMYIQERK